MSVDVEVERTVGDAEDEFGKESWVAPVVMIPVVCAVFKICLPCVLLEGVVKDGVVHRGDEKDSFSMM